MSEIANEVPGFLPTPLDGSPVRLEDLALELYQLVADSAARARQCEREAQERIEEITGKSNQIIAELASERFEFERLIARILPEIEKAGLEDVARVITLYVRSWDSNLRRAQIEVINLTGHHLTDEIAEVIEVESAISDPSISSVIIRETLSPLIKIKGRVISVAKVISSVPVQTDEQSSAGAT